MFGQSAELPEPSAGADCAGAVLWASLAVESLVLVDPESAVVLVLASDVSVSAAYATAE